MLFWSIIHSFMPSGGGGDVMMQKGDMIYQNGDTAQIHLAHIPEVVVSRIPQYFRTLNDLFQSGETVINSQSLGKILQITPAQIRKDLSYFGKFGKQGKGYNVEYLLDALRGVLGLDREWKVAVIGVGRLGRAIIGYPGFGPDGFKIVASFDEDPRQVGQSFGGLIVRPMSELANVVSKENIKIAIVAVPASQANKVVNMLVEVGIKAILNYAPTSPITPKNVRVRNIDPIVSLQAMTFYLQSEKEVEISLV